MGSPEDELLRRNHDTISFLAETIDAEIANYTSPSIPLSLLGSDKKSTVSINGNTQIG